MCDTVGEFFNSYREIVIVAFLRTQFLTIPEYIIISTMSMFPNMKNINKSPFLPLLVR